MFMYLINDYFNRAIHVLMLIKPKLDVNPIILMCACGLRLMVDANVNGIISVIACAAEMNMQNSEY